MVQFRLHLLCIPRGGGGSQRKLRGDLKMFLEEIRGMKKISEGKKGVANFFSCCLRGPLMLLFSHYTGAPNVNFQKISVRKAIRDLEFSEHLL